MHYTGRIDASSSAGDKGSIFDSSLTRGNPFSFGLGQGQVIRGWDEGLLGMCVGEKRTLVIPPDLGYGDRGAGAKIPPGATLNFEVECLGINDPKKGDQRNIFGEMDANKDGFVDHDEFSAWFTNQGNEVIFDFLNKTINCVICFVERFPLNCSRRKTRMKTGKSRGTSSVDRKAPKRNHEFRGSRSM